MMSLGRVLSGLKASEAGLDVTSKNITNAQTDGYKRQRLLQSDKATTGTSAVVKGIGVQIDGIQQIYSSLKEEVYQGTLAGLGELDIENDVYDQIQVILGSTEGKDILQNTMEEVWSAVNMLSADPGSLTYKTNFRESLVSLIEQTEGMMDELNSLQNTLNEDIEKVVGQINDYAYEIQELNLKINTYEAKGLNSSELKDRRSAVAEELSKLIDVTVEESSNTNSLLVRLGGSYLVSDSKIYEMTLVQNTPGSVYTVPAWELSGTRVEVGSGKLKGLLDARGYEVSTNMGSVSAGSPQEETDIVFSIDPTSDLATINSIKANISSMLDTLDSYDIDSKFYLNIMGTGTTTKFDDKEALKNYLETWAPTGSNNITNSVNSFNDAMFREGSNRYLMVFSDKPANIADPDVAVVKLNNIDMKVIAVTDNENLATVNSWSSLTEGTDGSVYNINDVLTQDGLENIGGLLVDDINSELGKEGFDGIVSGVKANLNSFMNVFVREINAIFEDGINVEGQKNTDGDLDIFTKRTGRLGFEIGNIEINPLLSDLNNMPLSGTGAVGDNSLAQKMVDLRSKLVFNSSDGGVTLDGYFSNFILDLGLEAQDTLASLDNQESMVNEADKSRKFVSGVSLDEELVNLIKYQNAYTASSKMLTVMNEMLQIVSDLV